MLGASRRRALGLVVAALLAVAGPVLLRPSPALAAGGYFPAGWATPTTSIGAYVSDGGGSGINPAASYVTLDGQRLPSKFAAGKLSAEAKDMAEGPHTAAIHVEDHAGNALDFAWQFTVDGAAPALTDPSPTGAVEDRTPTIVVLAADADSGIDADSATLTIERRSNLQTFSSTVVPDYDPATGAIAYQVPDIPTGPHLGRGPLPDGDYVITVVVDDVAGNRTAFAWPFSVKTLPVALP